MNLLRCNNKHFYDGDLYTSCPYCDNKIETKNENVFRRVVDDVDSDDKTEILFVQPVINKEGFDNVTSGTAILETPNKPENDSIASEKMKKPATKVAGFGIIALAVVVLFGAIISGIYILDDKDSRYEKQIERGQNYLEESNYGKAISAYKKAMAIDPENPYTYRALADIYIELNDAEAAEKILKKGIKETDNKKLESMLADVERMINDDGMITAATSEFPVGEAEAGITDNESAYDVAGETLENENDSLKQNDKAEQIQRNGEYVIFGTYEQDGNSTNGQEPIEWEVIEDTGYRMLLISRYILDAVDTNEDFSKGYTWKKCELRKWLNEDFYNSAFDENEKNMIPTVKLVNQNNEYFGTDGGSNTEDKVFFLSVDEIRQYYVFNTWDSEKKYGFCRELMAEATQQAKNNGLDTHIITEKDYKGYLSTKGYRKDCIGLECGWWWLRTPGKYGDPPRGVDFDGDAGWGYVKLGNRQGRGIRPAIYIEY